MPQEKKEFALSDFTPYDLKEGEEYMNEAQQDHEAAMAIYRKTVELMRMTLGRGA